MFPTTLCSRQSTFLNLDFLPRNFRPHFPTAMIFPFPLHKLIPPPPLPGGNKELYTPLNSRDASLFDYVSNQIYMETEAPRPGSRDQSADLDKYNLDTDDEEIPSISPEVSCRNRFWIRVRGYVFGRLSCIRLCRISAEFSIFRKNIGV